MNSGKESGWLRATFSVVLVAAVFGALYLANDTFIMHQIILSEDPFTAVSTYLIFGGWVGTLCFLVYNTLLGKWLDRDYPGFNFGTWGMQLLALVSGAIAAGSTAFCLAGNQNLDPSLVTALSNLSILYLIFYDWVGGRVALVKVWLPALLVIGGSILASVTRLAGGFEITLLGILILLVGRCGTDALEKVVRKLGGERSDAVTFTFWRMFWLSVTGTIFAVAVAFARGTYGELTALLGSVWWTALPWVLLTMFFVFFFSTLLQKALKTEEVSKVSMVLSLQIALGIPLTLAADRLWPGIFGEIPSDLYVWVLRFVGVVLMIWGAIRLWSEKPSD